MDSIDGVVILVQESRFQLIDRDGVGHHFILSHKASAEPGQLPRLQRDQPRVRVGYQPADNVIAHTAMRIDLLDA